MTTDGHAPLLFQPVLLPKVWGGRRLTQLNKPLPAGAAIGESWELADLSTTSASGAGGQAVRSVITSGPLAGKTLHEALEAHGEAIMGSAAAGRAAASSGFPLLVKFLDASQNLSVQVHPSPGFVASKKGVGVYLKTESWYIVDADPGAKLFIGVNPGVTRADFALAARSSSPDLVGMLRAVPAIPGECHTLPSGTIHALGEGVLVAEVQTPSDTTFRLYDWGRQGREMHIPDALRCCRFDDDPAEARIGPDEPPTMARLEDNALCARLATTGFYTIDEARPLAGDTLTIGHPCKSRAVDAPLVLMVLAGSGRLSHTADAYTPQPIAAGQTILIPAASARQTVLHAAENLRVLRIGLRTEPAKA